MFGLLVCFGFFLLCFLFSFVCVCVEDMLLLNARIAFVLAGSRRMWLTRFLSNGFVCFRTGALTVKLLVFNGHIYLY